MSLRTRSRTLEDRVERHVAEGGSDPLGDASGYVYGFARYRLLALRSVVVHTGSGRKGPFNRDWDSDAYICNKLRDIATLRGTFGALVDSCQYRGLPGHMLS